MAVRKKRTRKVSRKKKRSLTALQKKYFAKGRPQPKFRKRRKLRKNPSRKIPMRLQKLFGASEKDIYEAIQATHKRKVRKSRKQKVLRAITKLQRNPVSKFVLCASVSRSAKHWYYRQSTASFVDSLKSATLFKSVALAKRIARSILDKLPPSVASIKVDAVRT